MSRYLPIDQERHRNHRLRNRLQSLLLLGGMVSLLAACGWIVLGAEGVLWIVLFGILGLMISARFSPQVMLRLYNAVPLSAFDLPEVHAIVDELARRADLPRKPDLYVIASPTMNAFSVGNPGDAAIAVTGGLLRALSLRELAGVLAHEISHIRRNDIWVMSLADMISRMTRTMSLAGMVLLLLNVPLMLTGAGQVSWLLVLLLLFAPVLGSLLQLALSRTREYDADLDAAGLTGDAIGLASALQKLERYNGRIWEDIFLPGRRHPDPSVLRTHPLTEERVKRLLALHPREDLVPLQLPRGGDWRPSAVPASPPYPRWRRSGLWY